MPQLFLFGRRQLFSLIRDRFEIRYIFHPIIRLLHHMGINHDIFYTAEEIDLECRMIANTFTLNNLLPRELQSRESVVGRRSQVTQDNGRRRRAVLMILQFWFLSLFSSPPAHSHSILCQSILLCSIRSLTFFCIADCLVFVCSFPFHTSRILQVWN